MSQPIRKLHDTVINQIAAGEIIERPASVVKELIENSIDAQAQHITVSIRDGGRAALCVSDDGSGIASDQLTLAVERHTTSKLSDNNLNNIITLGFRGEALPSIATVSRLTLTSRIKNTKNAWSLVVDGGRKSALSPALYSVGTKIDVVDLFHNIPARLKFLKSVRTETDQIREIVFRLALMTPQIAFTVKTEKKCLFKTFATDQETRIRQLLGDTFLENAIPIELTRDALALQGYISIPTFNRNTTQHLYLFVNQRPVRDRLLYNAIKAAYGDLLPHDRFPMVVLCLDIPYEWVDVNVHPTKAEVRFRDSPGVKDMVVLALQQALTTLGHQTATTHSTAALTAMHKNIHQPVSKAVWHETLPYKAPPAPSESPWAKFPTSRDQTLTQLSAHHQVQQQIQTTTPITTQTKTITPTHTNHIDNHIDTLSPSVALSPALIDDDNHVEYPLGYAQTQIHKTYIITQTKDGMVLVDQHAAHERILYEQLKAALEKEHLDVKHLLIPVVVSLEQVLVKDLLEYKEVLKRFGIELEAFGIGCVIIHTIPFLLESINLETLIVDIADHLKEYQNVSTVQTKLENVCASLACHGAIRAGQSLSIEEMNLLLRKIECTPNSAQCNHGRPTSIPLKLSDIERLFERR